MKHKFLLLYCWFVRSALFFLPDHPLLMRLRGILYSIFIKKCGSNFQVTHSAMLSAIENLTIGNNVYIAQFCIVAAHGGLVIGDNVMVGHHSVIASASHARKNGYFSLLELELGPVKIESGAWVTAHCTVLPHSILPAASVLGAGSVLNKAFTDAHCLYAGVPATLIRKLD